MTCKFALPSTVGAGEASPLYRDVAADGRHLVAAGRSRNVAIFSLESKTLLKVAQLPSKLVNSVKVIFKSVFFAPFSNVRDVTKQVFPYLLSLVRRLPPLDTAWSIDRTRVFGVDVPFLHFVLRCRPLSLGVVAASRHSHLSNRRALRRVRATGFRENQRLGRLSYRQASAHVYR